MEVVVVNTDSVLSLWHKHTDYLTNDPFIQEIWNWIFSGSELPELLTKGYGHLNEFKKAFISLFFVSDLAMKMGSVLLIDQILYENR